MVKLSEVRVDLNFQTKGESLDSIKKQLIEIAKLARTGVKFGNFENNSIDKEAKRFSQYINNQRNDYTNWWKEKLKLSDYFAQQELNRYEKMLKDKARMGDYFAQQELNRLQTSMKADDAKLNKLIALEQEYKKLNEEAKKYSSAGISSSKSNINTKLNNLTLGQSDIDEYKKQIETAKNLSNMQTQQAINNHQIESEARKKASDKNRQIMMEDAKQREFFAKEELKRQAELNSAHDKAIAEDNKRNKNKLSEIARQEKSAMNERTKAENAMNTAHGRALAENTRREIEIRRNTNRQIEIINAAHSRALAENERRNLNTINNTANLMMAASIGSIAGIYAGVRQTLDMKDLEKQTFDLAVIANKSRGDINELRDSLVEISKTLPFTAAEIGKAINDVARTGKTMPEAIAIVKESAQLAMASGGKSPVKYLYDGKIFRAYNTKLRQKCA